MKRNLLLTALLMVVPFNLMAQDDLYFVPSKKAKQEAREQAEREARTITVIFDQEDDVWDQEVDPDYHTGTLRDADDYNRRVRGHDHPKTFGEIRVGNDTLYITEEQLALEDSLRQLSQSQQHYEDEEDYNVSSRLVRFHGGLRSPYYWDYYYDWAYDPFFYDPWYYGPGYSGWYGPYYGPAYRHGWYGWYDPWYDFGWGWNSYLGFYGGYYNYYGPGYWGGGYVGPGYAGGGYGHGSNHNINANRTFVGSSARRGLGATTGPRGTNGAITVGRGNAIAGNSEAGHRGANSSMRGLNRSGEEVRTGGINNLMRRDGLNTDRSYQTTPARGRVGESTTVQRGNRTQVQTPARSQNQTPVRTQPQTPVRSQTQTQTPVRSNTSTYTPTTSSSGGSFGGGAGMGGRSGGGAGMGGRSGGGRGR